MKRLLFIVEGDTEKEFVTNILAPYFGGKGFHNIACYKIKHSKGGLNKYAHLRKDLLNSIHESDTIVTTLIDYYGLPTDFPGFKAAQKILSIQDRISFLELKIKQELEATSRREFPNVLPYIQLHEFEALIFSSLDGLKAVFTESEADFKALSNVLNQYPNPEMINNSPVTAPSKRLLAHVEGYNKVVDGVQILRELGLGLVRSKCPRFNAWISNLENLIR
jgi:hypothetical protein